MVPDSIQNNEKVVRVIFSPFHLNKKKTKLQANAFRSLYDKDEVSVTRINYTTANFCKRQGKKIESEESQKGTKKEFYGLAVVGYSELIDLKIGLRASPIMPENPFHADIFYGCIRKRNEPLPSEVNERINRLAKEVARYYPDPNKNSESWDGHDLK